MTYDSEVQDILDRRVYVIRPNPTLVKALSCVLDEDDLNDLFKPHVVMTDELYFEKHLEGWRKKILEKCKITFVTEQLEFGVLFSISDIENKLSSLNDKVEFFNKWYIAEEAEYTQIETNWHLSNV